MQDLSPHQMENKRCFPNHFADYKGSLVSGLDSDVGVVIIDGIGSCLARRAGCTGVWLGWHTSSGLYRGLAGVAYKLYYVSQCPVFSARRDTYLCRAGSIIESCVLHYDRELDRETQASFLLGGVGAYAAATIIYKAAGQADYTKPLDRFQELGDMYMPLGFLKCGSDELFMGRSGYLCTALFLLLQGAEGNGAPD